MLLSHRTSVNIRPEYSNMIGHMCYAASKLWNVCNYERRRYKELGLEKYPDWYYQKKAHRIVNIHMHGCLKGGGECCCLTEHRLISGRNILIL